MVTMDEDFCRVSMRFTISQRLVLEWLAKKDRRRKTQQVNWLVEEELKRRGMSYDEALEEALADPEL